MGSLGSDTYLEKLLQGISRLRAQKALCDVTLEAEGVCFPAHKIILASASNYCKILFVGNATRTGNVDGSIRLDAVSAAGLSNVLSFIYSNKLDLSLQNVEETFKAAEALLVGEVISLCFRFLESCLSGENCMDILRIAKKLGPAQLREKAMRCVGQHFKQLLANPQSLKDLDRGTLCEILDRTTTEGSSELELLRVAVSWLQHDRRRLQYMGDILKRVRFPLIPFRDLQRYIQEIPLTRLDWGCCRLLQDALTPHLQLCSRPSRQSPHTALRSASPALLIAGGRTSTNSICREMWAAEQSCGAWRKVGDLCVPLYNHCIVAIDDLLFVLGGQSTFDPTGKQPSNEVSEETFSLGKGQGRKGILLLLTVGFPPFHVKMLQPQNILHWNRLSGITEPNPFPRSTTQPPALWLKAVSLRSLSSGSSWLCPLPWELCSIQPYGAQQFLSPT